jgi:2-succinyl-5-enolpyruvyl-6-hydroxy-3-cyclohexene-1-carboxylate synthase
MQNSLSAIWSKIIINQLVEDGHDYFCISPGSRSTPLILAIESQKDASSFIHFDERSLAFHALGYSKIAPQAPVVVVTSGTACGNLLPALMESYESLNPIIVLTADRPFELQDSGSNQTTKHQPGMFKNFVCYELNLPAPDGTFLENLRHLIHRASYLSKKHKKSVHINCCFKEPFALTLDAINENFSTSLISYAFEKNLLASTYQDLAFLLNHSKKGVILLGSDAFKCQNSALFGQFFNQIKWPIFADVLSLTEVCDYQITHYSLILKQLHPIAKDFEDLNFDCVLHFGGSFVSKHVCSFFKKAPPRAYIHVFSQDHRYDPLHLVTHKLELDPSLLCEHLLPLIEIKEKVSPWFDLNLQFIATLDFYFSTYPSHSEAYFFWKFKGSLAKFCNIFIGNSMPIRELTDFFHPMLSGCKIYANRGLSGIDGNIATSIGIAKALNQPVIAIIGDQTFLHDSSSLSQLKILNAPFKLIVLNNGGGQIFSHLPINQLKTICQKYFINPHHARLNALAQAFDVPYFFFENPEMFFNDSTCIQSQDSCMIEIITHANINLETHQQLACIFQDALSTHLCKN